MVAGSFVQGRAVSLVWVADGEEALAEFQRRRFQTVVSDICMPGMDGISLLSAVRELDPSVLRVILTGFEVVEAQAVAHLVLHKPCPARTLGDVILERRCNLNRKRILVVDDHPYVLAGLAGSLRRMAGCEVVLALGAGDARQELEKGGGFDVIVADLHMPGGDGEQLLEYVMTTYPATRRIILTGDSVSEQAQRARVLCHRFLEKPCDPSDLQAAIRFTLELAA